MSEVHNNSETEKVPTLYLNSNGTGTLYISGCQCYMIDDIYAAVAVLNDLYNKGVFNAARPVINLAFDLAKKAEQSSEKFRKTLTKLYGLAGDTHAELGEYDSALKFYKNFQCLKMQLKPNLFRDTLPLETIKLYQFRKFSNYALSNLLNRQMTELSETVTIHHNPLQSVSTAYFTARFFNALNGGLDRQASPS